MDLKLKPYRPQDHRVERKTEPPIWKNLLLVVLIFGVAPFAACAVVVGISDREPSYFIAGVLVLAACIYYAMRNLEP